MILLEIVSSIVMQQQKEVQATSTLQNMWTLTHTTKILNKVLENSENTNNNKSY